MIRRIISLIIAFGILFMFSTTSFATIHAGTNNNVLLFRYQTDSWFNAEPRVPEFNAFYYNNSDNSMFFGEYYQNDFLFVDLAINQNDFSNSMSVKGSYLFDFGLYVKLDYLSSDISNQSNLAAGYRWGFDEYNYLAIGMDITSGDSSSGIQDIDIDGKYYTDSLKCSSEMCIPLNEDNEFTYQFDIAYKLTDTLTGSFSYFKLNGIIGDGNYYFGVTYKPEILVIDVLYNGGDQPFYMLSGMYSLTDQLALGAQFDYYTGSSESEISLKAKYGFGDTSKIYFKYTFGSDDSMMFLGCNMYFDN